MDTGQSSTVGVTPKHPALTAPTTVSGAVRLAIEDGRALLETEGYDFDADVWHAINRNGTCSVCAAGAVMARHFDLGRKAVLPYDFDASWNRALQAINAVREECFEQAYAEMAPGPYEREDAGVFADAVWAKLDEHGCDLHATFKGARGFARFLDRLESVTLPAIEHAQAEVARHKASEPAPAQRAHHASTGAHARAEAALRARTSEGAQR